VNPGHGCYKIEPGTSTRPAHTDNQESSTLDLVIVAPDLAGKVTEAVIAEDEITTGSDHETLAWKVYIAQGQPPVKEARWKKRQPKDNDELEKWRKAFFGSVTGLYRT
jgi:hypothetical protein